MTIEKRINRLEERQTPPTPVKFVLRVEDASPGFWTHALPPCDAPAELSPDAHSAWHGQHNQMCVVLRKE